ncbi:MAG: hypothetical protein LBS97_05805 [Treponema sp.]|jgi:hypothetical protein|nr:hypothetical protein [Treponema sp.]
MTREERREEQKVYREVMAPILATKRKISKMMRTMTKEQYDASFQERMARIEREHGPIPWATGN